MYIGDMFSHKSRLIFLAVSMFGLLGNFSARAEIQTSERSLILAKTIYGDISPKSVRSSGTGFVSAHNMMYRHSITVYDANTLDLIATIKDSVKPSQFGFSDYAGTYRGAPVEGAFSPDGKFLYVTNYSMYGKGLNKEGTDICSPADNFDSSFLYRVSTENWKIDAIYKVGTVPKVVAVTPDNGYVLVSHWCSYDLYVISTKTQNVEKILKIGAYPRGITVSADSKYAFVAQMGGSTVHKINLDTWKREQLSVGVNPRAIVLSPDNSTLYATLNKSGQVVAYNLNEKKVIQKIKTGEAARSLDISSDGSSLYVVNFKSGTLSKIRVSDFQILQEIKVCKEPIGVSFEVQNLRVWVACYGGSIKVFDEV